MGEGRRFGGSRDDKRSAAWHTRRPAFKAGTVRSWSRFHVLIVGMIAVLALGAALSFDAVGTSNARASVEGGNLPASTSGVVITLENAGPSTIAEATMGFDLPPIDPGQTLVVRIGDPYSPTDLGEVQFGGSSVSRTNPLPPGGVGCIGPLPQLLPGTYVEFEEILWFGNGFSTSLSFSIVTDESALPFDFAHPAVPGGTLNGTWRFLSTVPPECGPSPSVDPALTDSIHPVNATVTGVVGTKGSTKAALSADSESAPSFAAIISLVVILAVVSSTAAIFVRRGRKKHRDPPRDRLVAE